jgi:hypothetical protein
MDETKSPGSGTTGMEGLQDPSDRAGYGSEAREEMLDPGENAIGDTQGENNTGREPEYYGDEQDPA